MAVFGKAQYIKRVEDDRLLTGKGGFTDNQTRPNQVHVVLVRSPHAHAKILKIDPSAALKSPGVVAVYTWADMEKEGSGYFVLPAMFPNADGKKPDMTPRRPMAKDVVRYVGEVVAAVVAETRAQATDAVELVEVEYEQLPSVTEIDDALKPDAPQVWQGAPGNRVGFNRFGDAAKADAAFKAAAHVVSLDVVHQRLIVNAMEPRAIMAEWDGDRILVHIGSQNPSVTRDSLADIILKMPKDKVRVLVREAFCVGVVIAVLVDEKETLDVLVTRADGVGGPGQPGGPGEEAPASAITMDPSNTAKAYGGAGGADHGHDIDIQAGIPTGFIIAAPEAAGIVDQHIEPAHGGLRFSDLRFLCLFAGFFFKPAMFCLPDPFLLCLVACDSGLQGRFSGFQRVKVYLTPCNGLLP